MDDSKSFISCESSENNSYGVQSWTPKPTSYDGSGDIEDWLYTSEELSMLNNWNDSRKVNLLPILLINEARTWWRSFSSELVPEQRQWKNIKEALIKRFKPTPNAGMAWSKLLSLKQVSAVASYIDNFNILANECAGITEIAKMNIFIFGLKPWLRDRVFNGEPEDFSTAKEIATKCETFNSLSYDKKESKHENTDAEIDMLEEKLSKLKLLRQENKAKYIEKSLYRNSFDKKKFQTSINDLSSIDPKDRGCLE